MNGVMYIEVEPSFSHSFVGWAVTHWGLKGGWPSGNAVLNCRCDQDAKYHSEQCGYTVPLYKSIAITLLRQCCTCVYTLFILNCAFFPGLHVTPIDHPCEFKTSLSSIKPRYVKSG